MIESLLEASSNTTVAVHPWFTNICTAETVIRTILGEVGNTHLHTEWFTSGAYITSIHSTSDTTQQSNKE